MGGMDVKHSDLAAALGVTVAAVSQWFSGRPPINRCPDIERVYGGRKTCEELRPDVRWARVPDPEWPHPEGRPTIDVAAPELIETKAAEAA